MSVSIGEMPILFLWGHNSISVPGCLVWFPELFLESVGQPFPELPQQFIVGFYKEMASSVTGTRLAEGKLLNTGRMVP
jgi:hypothetical protein